MVARRELLKAMGGIAAGTALAGCSENAHDAGRNDNPDDYDKAKFADLAAEPDEHKDVRVKGYLQWDGRKQWWDENDERMFHTYDLYKTDPDTVDDPDDLASIPVVEYDDDINSSLPNEEMVNGTVFHVEVWGESDVLYEEGLDGSSDANHGQDVIKGHEIRRIAE